MFENIIGQAAANQLGEDLRSGRLAPSMLFFGPPASGKGSAGLELARALSCEDGAAAWNCPCPACARHRYLLHPDLLILGPRPFSAEIAASSAALAREPDSPAGFILFIRSVRKLLARFSPVLWEDDPRLGKLNSLLQSLEEDLDDFEILARDAAAGIRPGNGGAAENGAGRTASEDAGKLCASVLKNALRLEGEGLGETIPIARIRRAAYWSRLAPSGRRKTLLIENADRMQEGARNSLLKLLEEPPETISIVLTAPRREAILPTLLSRLRPYRFLKRNEDRELEVIRRVFRDKTPSPGDAGSLSVGAYLDGFLPQPDEKLRPLAAFFASSLARAALVAFKKKGLNEIPGPLASLGKYCAPIAEAAGFGRLLRAGDILPAVLAASGNFEGPSFPRFLRLVLSQVREALKEETGSPLYIAYNDIWRKYTAEAEAASGVWNQSPALALESLFYRLREGMVSAAAGLRPEKL
ncbi:MAG: DNA polymerase III [Treponema sp.]|jgi:DNA polymerase-3 subunit gamma/tau|nr:DNA polymerase III [Treponema sp.]